MDEVSSNLVLSISLALMLLALPLVSAGAWNDIPALWVAGLVVLALGAAIPPTMRFVGDEDEGDDS